MLCLQRGQNVVEAVVHRDSLGESGKKITLLVLDVKRQLAFQIVQRIGGGFTGIAGVRRLGQPFDGA